ncbi:MAG TPA: class I SAM-dependent methyltransferase [Desulfomonilia bacterium]|nr:class I SAM-dependent methyltransferase [Desulfomonilia bacterium]
MNGTLSQAGGTIVLKPGRDASVLRRHPWIFSGAVAEVKGTPVNGGTVDVLSADGSWLAAGAYSDHSQIRVRIWSFTEGEKIDHEFFRNRLEMAMGSRADMLASGELDACRLVNAESDGLPGLVVDRYDGFLVCQFLSSGAEFWKPDIVSHLAEAAHVRGIYERSDADTRVMEGLASATGLLTGEDPPGLVEIHEHGLRFLVDIRKGHKTGFYLDQRDNRLLAREFSGDAEVLNCFSYTGGFGLAAIRGGALQTTNVESSPDAVALGLENAALNGMDSQFLCLEDDVFRVLRAMRDADRKFDLVILDPPKFAGSARQVQGASRGYKDINLLAFKLLNPGGTLFTFSCSGHIPPDLFRKIVADAALDAGRDARIIRHLGQSRDHPIALPFPEGHYLKGLIVKVW